MIGYHYNKEKRVIVAFFCDDVSRKFEGRKYWYRNICKSLWKVFDNGLIQYSDFSDIVKKDVDTIQVVTKVKVTEDCDKELAKKIAKDRLIIKWADLEYRIVNDVFSKINTRFEVTKHRVNKKMRKTDEKIKRITSSYQTEN
jgi:hypothetical protein